MATWEYTVNEYAGRERVDPKTVRRWIAKGAVDVRRTPGGGLRVLERRSDSGRVVNIGAKKDIHGHPAT